LNHNFYSLPSASAVQYDWSPDFDHACVNWRGHDVCDLVRIAPLWYVVANKTFLRFRTEGAARRHIARVVERVERRLAGPLSAFLN
jgi:hypothetical protein